MAHANAYSSSVLANYKLEQIKPDLNLARIANQTVPLSDKIHYVIETAGVSPFPAPIYHEGIVYVDARPFTTLDRDGSLKIKDIVEHRIRVEQAQWELIWVTQPISHESIAEQLKYHREIFAKWLSDSVNFTYALNAYQSMQVLALSSLFAVGQYYNNVDDVNAIRLQENLAKQFFIQYSMYETVTGNTDYLFPRDIDEYIKMIKAADLTPRLNDFGRVSLITMLSRSFWGVSNDTVLCTLAIEYPPALMAIMRTCIDNSSFKRTKIGKLVDNNKSKNAHEGFVKAYDHILMRHGSELRSDVFSAKLSR